MDDFERIDTLLFENLAFLRQAELIDPSISRPSGFDLLGLSICVPSVAEAHACCGETRSRIAMVEHKDRSATQQVMLALDCLEAVLADPDTSFAYVEWLSESQAVSLVPITPIPKLQEPVQPPAHLQNITPRIQRHEQPQAPKRKIGPIGVAVPIIFILIIVSGLFVNSIRHSREAIQYLPPGQTTTVVPPKMVDPPVEHSIPPTPSAKELLDKSTNILGLAVKSQVDYNLGVEKKLSPDPEEKLRGIAFGRDALEILNQVALRKDLDSSLLPILYCNRAYARALIGDPFDEDIRLARKALTALPSNITTRTIEGTVGLLEDTLPHGGKPPKKMIWLH